MRRSLLSITLNGVPSQFPDALFAAELVEQLGYTGKRVALERNGEVIPKSLYASTLLADGDVLEIVVAVGGG